MSDEYRYGPFEADDPKENVPAYPRRIEEPPPPYAAHRAEIVEYFTARQKRLKVVKTTELRRGQLVDWIPVETQDPRGYIADPPSTSESVEGHLHGQDEQLARPELELDDCERGSPGMVPVLRKKLDALGYTHPLRQYLSKYRGNLALDSRAGTVLAPGPGSRGTHWLGRSSQGVLCFGGEGQFSCFDPFTASSAEFSLIQIGLSNHDLPSVQSVEAGWQEYRDITGDWVPHLFIYYTTNGYAKDEDGQGGYNMDVDGWVQYDNVIFPGTTLTPYSQTGGEQRKITIKYQLYRDNWWLQCQGRWVGYYPSRLFMGNQSVFSTLGDHADRIGFWGEVASFNAAATRTDMGSGRFPNEGWTRAAYMHNLRVQTQRDGGMADYNGAAGLSATDSHLYDIEAHFGSGTDWGSYVYVGGPGAG